MGVLPLPVSSCVSFVCLAPSEVKEGLRSPATGVPEGSQLPCGCWALNPCPLEEQPVLLTAEPSLHPNVFYFKP